MSLKLIPHAPIINMATVAEIKAWYRAGDKLISEPIMAYLSDVTRPPWVKLSTNSAINHWPQLSRMSKVTKVPAYIIINCMLVGTCYHPSMPPITEDLWRETLGVAPSPVGIDLSPGVGVGVSMAWCGVC